jgi:2-polyprenyl-3-methyl-5-hydroxy-6-metoxy-1,4-benzoquinol methylase
MSIYVLQTPSNRRFTAWPLIGIFCIRKKSTGATGRRGWGNRALQSARTDGYAEGGRMDNGNDAKVIRQFDTIAFLPDAWDHNRQYQKYLLQNIGAQCGCALDVGCGTGELTKKLARFSKEVTGIDVSANMIAEARKRNHGENIEYLKISAEEYLEKTEKRFDVIISVAALHHMREETILGSMKNKLTKNGRILILDLVKPKTPAEWIAGAAAALANPVAMLAMRGRLKVTKEEKQAWADHFHYDEYLTTGEVKAIVRRTLGKGKVKRHLFWRYSIVYKNGE